MKELLIQILGDAYAGLQSIEHDGRTWYNAKDLCEALGIVNRSLAIKGNARIGYFGVDAQDVCKLVSLGKRRLFISERGVFMLILKSRKPAAYLIKSRLSSEVLPAIMRSGVYSPEAEIGETPLSEIQTRLKKKAA